MHRLCLRRASGLDERVIPLAREARAEGHRFVDRLVDDWQGGENRFDQPGNASGSRGAAPAWSGRAA